MSEDNAYNGSGYRGVDELVGLKMRDGSTLVNGQTYVDEQIYIGTNDLGLSIVAYGGRYAPGSQDTQANGWYNELVTSMLWTGTKENGNPRYRWFRNSESGSVNPRHGVLRSDGAIWESHWMGKVRCVRDARTATQRVKLDGSGPCEGAISYTYDGHSYDLVEIGNDCWFAEDLQATVNAAGDSLVLGTDYRYPNDSVTLVEKLGHVYTLDAAMESCPTGWHLASDNEWSAAEVAHGVSENQAYNATGFYGEDELLGLKMRDGSSPMYTSPTSAERSFIGTNNLGMSLVVEYGLYTPGGWYAGDYAKVVSVWWTPEDNGVIWRRWMDNTAEPPNTNVVSNKRKAIQRKEWSLSNLDEYMAKARCVRDARTAAQRVKLDGSGPCKGDTTYTYDGHSYDLVEIGNDCWFAEDLQTTVNAAGDTLVLGTDYRYPIDDAELGPSYGMYYTWYAGMESCPTGWHLASDNEWSAAEVAHGMSESDAYTVTNYRGDIGLKMRDGSTLVHGSSSGPSLTYIGTNDLGMSIVPYGGFYTADGGWYTQSATATAAYYTSTVERDGGNLFIWERWFRNDEDRRKTPARWLWTAPLDGDEMGKIRCVRDGRTAAQRVKLDGSGPCEGVASYTYDGHAYDLVEIGNDCWFAEDLQTTVNAAGDTLVLETDYRYPLDSAELVSSYAMFYTWDVGMESCPTGWHMASDNEWSAAEVAHGMSEDNAYNGSGYRGVDELVGLKMRDGSTLVNGQTYVDEQIYIGTNDLGLSIVAYGGRYAPGSQDTQANGWYNELVTSMLWTGTKENGNPRYRWFRNSESGSVNPRHGVLRSDGAIWESHWMGKVRCVRDARTATQRVKLDGSGPCEGAISYTYDGHSYDLVEIGNDCWFAEDLQATVNAAGDSLVLGTDYRYPNDSVTLVEKLGHVYTLDAAMESCPTGWHLASDNEWSAAEVAHGVSENQAYNATGFYGEDELLGLKMRDGSSPMYTSPTSAERSFIGTNNLGMSLVVEYGLYTPGGWYAGDYAKVVSVWWTPEDNGVIWRRWMDNTAEPPNTNVVSNKRKAIQRKEWSLSNLDEYMAKARCVRDGRTSAQRVKLDGSGPCAGAISYTYDGHSYDLVEIGNDCWFAEDLQATVNGAGEDLVLNTDYRYPNDDSTLVEKLGLVYRRDLTTELCPSDWHVASDNEWSAAEVAHGMLESDAYDVEGSGVWRGGAQFVGLKMRDGRTPVYPEPLDTIRTLIGTNDLGMSLRPEYGSYQNGNWYVHNVAVWFTGTESNDGHWVRWFENDDVAVGGTTSRRRAIMRGAFWPDHPEVSGKIRCVANHSDMAEAGAEHAEYSIQTLQPCTDPEACNYVDLTEPSTTLTTPRWWIGAIDYEGLLDSIDQDAALLQGHGLYNGAEVFAQNQDAAVINANRVDSLTQFIFSLDENNWGVSNIHLAFPMTDQGATISTVEGADAVDEELTYWGIPNGVPDTYAESYFRFTKVADGTSWDTLVSVHSEPFYFRNDLYINTDSLVWDLDVATLQANLPIEAGDEVRIQACHFGQRPGEGVLAIDSDLDYTVFLCAEPTAVALEPLQQALNSQDILEVSAQWNKPIGGVTRVQRRINSNEESDWITIANLTNIDPSTYIDSTLGIDSLLCKRLEYRLELELCGSTTYSDVEEIHIEGDIPDPWAAMRLANASLETYKGFNKDYVEVDWSAVEASPEYGIDGYRLERRIYSPPTQNEEDDWEVVFNTSEDLTYEDYEINAGVLYEYRVVSIVNCNAGLGVNIEFKSPHGIGFRTAVASVNGQVTYGVGSPVPDVALTVTKTTGADPRLALQLPDSAFLRLHAVSLADTLKSGFVQSQWMKPLGEFGLDPLPIVSYWSHDADGEIREELSIRVHQESQQAPPQLSLYRLGNKLADINSAFVSNDFTFVSIGFQITPGMPTDDKLILRTISNQSVSDTVTLGPIFNFSLQEVFSNLEYVEWGAGQGLVAGCIQGGRQL